MEINRATGPPPDGNGAHSPLSTSPASPASGRPRAKIIRNQNACDACRSRKVRCLYGSGEGRCQGCTFLDIQCTHERPRRRRGPPNKHAQQHRQQQREQQQANATASVASQRSPSVSDITSPDVGLAYQPSPAASSSTHTQTPQSHSHSHPHPQTTATPHSATDLRAIIAGAPSPNTTTGSHHSNRLALFAPEDLIQRMLHDWFEKVHALAPVLHRRRFLHRLKAGETNSDRTFCALVVSVCAATVATLRRADYSPVTVELCLDFIEEQHLLDHGLRKPVYSLDWCVAMYNIGTSASSMNEDGLGDMVVRTYSGDCLSHQENRAHLRPLPLTDSQLETGPQLSHAELPPWHGDTTSYVPGLNQLSDLFLIWHEAQTAPMSLYGGQEEALKHWLAKIQTIIDNFPPELRWRGGLSRPSHITEGHDTQIANLFITSLNIRSNLLQKFGSTVKTRAEEHQRIVDDLLEILYHMPQHVLEQNGNSLIPKLRDCGAAYMEQMDVGDGALVSEGARLKLEKLLRKLDDIDCWPGLPGIESPQSNRQ
ncbi:c6 zinc finger domain containing protein [Colletotrichum scovillei]|uniref:C6 zinc finger domain containing protein n=1 Tax=Colletotrichum scovillei TaxID=1209932 RepID=A0A9P7R5X2_9PEZI|nr:c6 zinc finger domain containing protein [Colletotrichum scovillei]KAG7072963.1 c6 zinc finger domain containing protein [Colletotrichum scovillei]